VSFISAGMLKTDSDMKRITIAQIAEEMRESGMTEPTFFVYIPVSNQHH
jgi:hypothetical protein